MLPKELENIIYSYTHQLLLDDALNELCNKFGECDICIKTMKGFKLIKFCECSNQVCENCYTNEKCKTCCDFMEKYGNCDNKVLKNYYNYCNYNF